MGDPKEIDANRLIPCLSILEFFIQVVEDSDFADEEEYASLSIKAKLFSATSLSRHVQEAASFILEYVGKCQEERISLDMELLLVLYRFICAFLAVDGATIINKDLLNGSITTLVKVSGKI